MGKRLDSYFTKENMQMANKHYENRLNIIVIRSNMNLILFFKNTNSRTRYCYTLTSIAKNF